MKFGLVLLTSFGILLLFLTGAYAQPYHTLTVDDFQGTPHYSSRGVIAYTNCTIDFRYEARKENDYYRLDFNIRLIVNNNKSWMDTRRITSPQMLAEILKHEQGHYIIAFMEQHELLREVSRTVFRADYQYAAQNIFNRIDAKYKQLNWNYDEDTQHMTNRQQQQSWDAYFKQRLEYMPPDNP
jgi:hypothetical protein